MTDHDAIAHFTTALSDARSEAQAYDALCDLAKQTVGAKLFTVMTADMQAMLARRAYTDDPLNYPTSGTKPIEMDRWFEQVHTRHETFVANTLAEIDTVFPDAELIGQLGCGSVVNLPVILRGEMVATVNMLHEEGFYTPERVAAVRNVVTLPAMTAMALAETFGENIA
ncbi:GAF domain-containing protein [Paracoccus albus]|uniref:GAF domain-containing protein n=1 Tax=Paracoccus albus TaxID=3017784 RepID=UPI0022F05F33|nr:GAF domain-containing protein [Paracoccus albus]WBU61633.1 GAF domain-containing protein [Paracoccus albus]